MDSKDHGIILIYNKLQDAPIIKQSYYADWLNPLKPLPKND